MAKIIFKVVKWICILLGFFGLIGISTITWRGIKEAWKEYWTKIEDYYNPKPIPRYNYYERSKRV